MATLVVTMRIMPDSVEAGLDEIKKAATRLIAEFAGEGEIRASEQPIAFGLKALNLIFVMDEKKGSIDELEKDISELANVQSVEITDLRRAIG